MRFTWIGADAPLLRGDRFAWTAYGWALGATVAVTIVDHALHGWLAEANLIMIYLLAQVPVAMRGDRGAAIAGAVMSVLAFDFFFVTPYHSLTVSHTEYVLTFLVMGLVGVSLATFTAQLAAEASEAAHSEGRLRALYALSRSLLAARAPAEVLAEGARVLGRELDVGLGAWMKSAGGEPIAISPMTPPLNTSELALLRWVLQQGEPAGPGTDTFPGAAHLYLPVRTDTHVHGALALSPPSGGPLPADMRAMLSTGTNQIAIALEHARARDEAASARTQAEAERLRSTLLSSVSHDLRTPLTGIVGAAGSLVEGVEALPAEVRRELAQGILEEGDRLTRLVTNLLHATRLDAGGAQLRREWTPLEEVIAPALARLERTLAPHPLETRLPVDLPLVHGDPVLLEQVFGNLLENAAKYTPPGSPITIEAAADGDTLTVEVADEGPGLPTGEEARAFDKFRRYDRGGAPGAGLGLAIVKGVITAHGGTISAINRPGGGACFRFTLPIGSPPAPPDPPETSRRQSHG